MDGTTEQNLAMPAGDGWRPDPAVPGRMRYWRDGAWTAHVAADGVQYDEPYLGTGNVRWQYGVVNIGMFASMDRMEEVLAAAGEQGWELITIYDKSSNWFANMEKGFMLLKRPVPAGVRLTEPEWCITISMPGQLSVRGR